MLAKKGESPAPVVGNEALKIGDTGKCFDQSFSQNQSQNQTGKRTAAINTLLMLRQRFPSAIARLDLPSRRPLKVGIRDDIAAAMPEIAAADIGLALKIYTGHSAYLGQCTEGAARIDLDGEAAGSVTMQQAAYAAELMAKIRRKRRPTSPPASMAPSKKISLSDLKAAARKRAAVAQ
jgi:ProP effector